MYYKIAQIEKDIAVAVDKKPDDYDGSYELIREAVAAYERMGGAQLNSVIDKNDAIMLYRLVLHKNAASITKRVEKINGCNLSNNEKTKLIALLNRVAAKSYINFQSPGMFGTGTNDIDCSKKDATDFIKMMIDVLHESNTLLIYSFVERFLSVQRKKFGFAIVSEILHCLKPEIFPIINGQSQYYYEKAVSGFENDISAYVANCRLIDKHCHKINPAFIYYRTVDLCIIPYSDLVDFKTIMSFLNNYGGKKYLKVMSAAGDIEKDGKVSREELTILKDLVKKELSNNTYAVANCSLWRQSGQIPKYFWIPITLKNQENNLCLIAVCIEKLNGAVELYVRVELLNECVQADIDKFNNIINRVNVKGDIKFIISPDGGKFLTLNEANSIAIKSNEKICPAIKINEPFDMRDTDRIVQEIVQAVEDLTPYYDEFNNVIVDPTKGKNVTLEHNGGTKVLNLDTKNIILYGPPGTGKTYSAAKKAMEIIKGKEYPQDTAYTEIKEEYDINLKNGRIQFVTFHQSYGYEDFIEGIKAKFVGSKGGSNIFDDSNNGNGGNTANDDNKNKGGNVFYDVEDGIFKKFCNEARKNPKEKPYVFIIDEINRGNISKIFGELITLIEETKRESEDEAMSTTLPYSGDKFSVPSNVYIIGTMNTADRSIAVVDTALRRRFTFEEMMPDPDLVNIMVEDINIKDLLIIMNKRITVLRGREHTIGHSFFIELKDKPSMNLLGNIFKNKIIPLLQEYFFDDYENIRLVLGDNQKGEDDKTQFIIKDKMADDLFGKEGYENNGETVCFYKINSDAFNEPEAYRYLQKSKPNDKQEATSGDAE